jgi:hypothetical protein
VVNETVEIMGLQSELPFIHRVLEAHLPVAES